MTPTPYEWLCRSPLTAVCLTLLAYRIALGVSRRYHGHPLANTVLVGAQVSGRVTEIYVDFNDKVKKGQVIARIDTSLFDAQVAQQSANLASAKANLVRAEVAVMDGKRQYDRQKLLREQDLTAVGTSFVADASH